MTTLCHPPSPVEVRTHILAPFADGEYGSADDDLRAACAEAFERGRAEGRREADGPIRNAAAALQRALEAIEAESRRAAETRRRECVRLSLAIARRVVMTELRSRPEVIESVVDHLLAEAGEKGVTVLRLNPADAALLKRLPSGAALEKSGLTLRAHDEIEPGGCVAETRFGLVDARIATRLDEMASALLGDDDADAPDTGKETA